MPEIQLNLPTTSFVSRSGQVASPRIVNGYIEAPQDAGKHAFAIYSSPGLTRWNSGAYAALNVACIARVIANSWHCSETTLSATTQPAAIHF